LSSVRDEKRKAVIRVRQGRLHELDAFPGEPFGAGSVVEHLDAHPTGIADLRESKENRHEVDVAEARPLEIHVVGVEVFEMPAALADDLRNGE
jgi:hypothetical protein